MDTQQQGGWHRSRRRFGAITALGAILVVGGLEHARATENPMVMIDNFAFTPATLMVPVGTTVTWENGDDIPHSIVLSDHSFRSKPLDTKDRASFTFTKTGEMQYFCGLHPHMTGKIIVTPRG